ncbi:MAG: hypothetical protein WD749_06710 [Phycisphaerales bacterium]
MTRAPRTTMPKRHKWHRRPACVFTLLALLVSLLAALPARAETPADPPRHSTLFAEANAKFRDALATKDPEVARSLFTEAIARWAAITEGGTRSAELHVNIGNASLLAGDPGRALAAYRRAERLDAADPAVKAGLDAVRRHAGSTPPVPETLSEKALQWAGHLPRRALLGAFAIIWIAGWTVLLIRLLGHAAAPALRPLGPALLILGSLVAAPVVIAEAMESRLAHAVIVTAKAAAYNGPSDAVYQRTFQEGLPAGLEVRLLERRGHWSKVRLGDGRETWVRLSDLERI